MKRVVILGHFAFGKDYINGQTIKTKVISEELTRRFGAQQVGKEDTAGKYKFLLRLPLILFRMLIKYRNIIFLPAYKGVHVIVPLLVCLNIIFRRKLHYVVIGGWLPTYLQKYPHLKWAIRQLNGIYVETELMKQDILKTGRYSNIYVMPNCKSLRISPEEAFPTLQGPPYKICTFSRVIEEKGIADAVKAVEACNQEANHPLFVLHIYGPVEEPEWFAELMENRTDAIKYCGVVPYEDSIDILKNYTALLFPTYYHGEGFAGTIIDALHAGIPTIASNWKANPEFIEEGVTGLLYPARSIKALTEIITNVSKQPEMLWNMKKNCIQKARSYMPGIVLQTLIKQLN